MYIYIHNMYISIYIIYIIYSIYIYIQIQIYRYIYIYRSVDCSIPVVPHKAVAEVSKIGEVGCCESRMAERIH